MFGDYKSPLTVPRVTRGCHGSPRQSIVIQVREGEQVRTILPWVFKVSFPMKIMWNTAWTNHKAGNNWITQFVLKKLMVCFEDELKRMSLTPQILTNLVGKAFREYHGNIPPHIPQQNSSAASAADNERHPTHVMDFSQLWTGTCDWTAAISSTQNPWVDPYLYFPKHF